MNSLNSLKFIFVHFRGGGMAQGGIAGGIVQGGIVQGGVVLDLS